MPSKIAEMRDEYVKYYLHLMAPCNSILDLVVHFSATLRSRRRARLGAGRKECNCWKEINIEKMRKMLS